MGKLKLFISHSSRLDDVDSQGLPKDFNWTLLEETCNGLKHLYGDRIEILVDQDEQGLYPSCDWNQRLNEWLAECHAAIILFSKRAINTSEWVKKEATILSWRTKIDNNFKLVPVFLSGQAEIDDMKKELWSVLGIDEIQSKRSAATSGDIVQSVRLALGEPDALVQDFPQTPFEKLASNISKILSQETTSETLGVIWEELPDHGFKPVWHPDESTKFATALTRYLIRDGETSLESFRLIIDKLKPNPEKEKALELLKAIRSLWVDAKAAALIPKSSQKDYLVVMNGMFLLWADEDLKTKFYTMERYIERAWPDTDRRKIIPITSTDPDEIRSEIRQACGMKHSPLSPEMVDQMICNDSDNIIIYLDVSEKSGGLPGARQISKLIKLKDSYSKLIIIFAAGESLPLETSEQILAITPELDIDVEAKQFFQEKQARINLESKYGN